MDIGGVYGEHPGRQKQTGIASCWMAWRMVQPHVGRWAWEHACEPDPGVVVVGSDALAGNCD